MASAVLVLLLLLLVALTLRRPVYGIMCYYAIRMVIPSASRVASFSFNTVSLGLLLLCLLPHIKKYYRTADVRVRAYIKAVCWLVGCLFVLTFFGSIPLTFQWSALLQMFMTEMLPSILLALFLTKACDYKKFCRLVCVLALFTALYGIYTYLTSDNPIYTMFNTTGEEGYLLEDYATGRLGLEGIAVGIYNDKIALSLICLLLLTFLLDKTTLSKPLQAATLALVFVAMFLTTQRTALFCVGLFFAIMLLFDKQNKPIRRYFKAAVCLLVVVAVFSGGGIIMDSLYSLIYIFDDSMQQRLGIGGSSTEMRMLQFANGFSYLGLGHLLQGEGYSFPSYYYEHIYRSELLGLDPRFFGFESFLLQTLMSSGLIGIVVWFVGLFRMYKALAPVLNVYNIAFFASYFLAIIMTDTSASFYLFFFLLVLNHKRYLSTGQTISENASLNNNPRLQR